MSFTFAHFFMKMILIFFIQFYYCRWLPGRRMRLSAVVRAGVVGGDEMPRAETTRRFELHLDIPRYVTRRFELHLHRHLHLHLHLQLVPERGYLHRHLHLQLVALPPGPLPLLPGPLPLPPEPVALPPGALPLPPEPVALPPEPLPLPPGLLRRRR